MVKANVIPGKFLSCLLGIFIGILLTLGGLVGGGFYVYKNVKVGSLLGLLPQETDNWLSDEYAQNTIEGLVKELQSLANGDITLEKVAQISPAAGDKIDEVLDNVNQNGIVTLDRDALYKDADQSTYVQPHGRRHHHIYARFPFGNDEFRLARYAPHHGRRAG